MSALDRSIVLMVFLGVLFVGTTTQRSMRSVADFLAAGLAASRGVCRVGTSR